MAKEKQKAFINHKINGFRLTFPNGNSLSTIFGTGSYSENHDRDTLKPNGEIDFDKTYSTRFDDGSDTCETMPDCSEVVAKLLEATFPEECNGSVYGYMTFEKWLKMVNILNEYK